MDRCPLMCRVKACSCYGWMRLKASPAWAVTDSTDSVIAALLRSACDQLSSPAR